MAGAVSTGDDELRRWLRREPQPITLLVETPEGDRTVRIGQSKSRWRDAEAACSKAMRVEALDHEGAILRVYERSPVAVRREEESGQFVAIARLLSEAGDRGAERHAEAYRIAFEHQQLLVKLLSERLERLERAWHKLLMSQEPTVISDGEQPDMNTSLVTTLLGAAMAQQTVAPQQNGQK